MAAKPNSATGDRRMVIEDLVVAGATSAAFAVRPLPTAGGNLLNRLYSRGWLAKAQDGRWWVTEDGLRAVTPERPAMPADPRPQHA